MRCTVATLLSATAFSLYAFALPQSKALDTNLLKRYQGGWCGVHVTQFQKNEGPSGSDGSNANYRVTVNLYDALQDPVGGTTLLSVTGGSYANIDSQLPYVFEVEVGANDDMPVLFQYSGQAWRSSDSQCSVGGYDGGSRQIDCGFNC